jgi:hypothetical protein
MADGALIPAYYAIAAPVAKFLTRERKVKKQGESAIDVKYPHSGGENGYVNDALPKYDTPTLKKLGKYESALDVPASSLCGARI